jgi:hypothetical protein
MKTMEIFKTRTSEKLNETLEKTFGKKLNLETFSIEQLNDVRNKLRTQIHQFKQTSNFNETVENETYTKAQWMLDTVNAEIAEREEIAIDEHQESDEQDYESFQDEGTQGENMRKVTEGEIQQAQSIVTAKTMVDRVGRWIEELSGMENDTLLTLGDQIRDEMGQEQAKAFLSAVAPAIQQALENLKTTRETLATGMRTLTGEEQPAEIIGAEPAAAPADDLAGPAEPDAMNAEPDMDDAGADLGDEFAASEPAAGPDEAGRAKRESIERSNKLLKVLAG